MNPDAHVNLPPPVSEAPAPAFETTLPSPAAEQAPTHPESSVGNRPAAPAPASPVPVNAQAVQPLDTPAPASTASATSADAADDTASGELEREWIQKAKQIVAQTLDDPYQQNKQLAFVRTEYLQKRYGKVVKLAE